MTGRILFLILVLISFTIASSIDFSKMESVMHEKYGDDGVTKLRGWKSLMDKLERENASTDEKVDRVNAWFNRQVIWQSDDKVWKTNDYWATPIETIGRSKGDCEDFCIAKYYSLLSLGVSMKKLRLVYVKAKTSTGEQAHMVLAYYPSPDAEPMILDNLVTSIRSAGRRPDLSPVFSFNGEGVYSGTSSESKGGAEKLSRWQDLMKRTRDEGFN